jgi:cobalt/nickel transport system permease protein
MHVSPFDAYQSRVSPVHLLDARVKLLVTLAAILSISLMPVGAWPAYVLALALALSVAVASDLDAGLVLRRALIAVPFALAALPLLFTVEGPALLQLQLGSRSLVLSSTGLERFASIAVKSWLSVQVAILLTATTSLTDLLVAMRALRLPRLLVAIVGLMWRYLAVLLDEATRMVRARDARSGARDAQGGGRVLWRARVTGNMAGTLFLRGYERSERIYNAMLARGYDGTIRSLPLAALPMGQRVVLALGVAIYAALAWLALLLR